MKLREIPIPTGCTRVSVEQENDKIVILFEGNNKEFVLDLTGETESPPEIGDLAIFWNAGKEYLAVIALLVNKEWVPEAEKYPYKASNEEWYSHAIRFRNLSQFVKIIKHRFRNAQKNK